MPKKKTTKKRIPAKRPVVLPPKPEQPLAVRQREVAKRLAGLKPDFPGR